MADIEQNGGNYSYSDSGVIIPDTADIQTTVREEYRGALGSDLSLEEQTPQGRLIDVETTARQNTLVFNADMANVIINIRLSSGTALDAWGANFDIARIGAYSSTVPVMVTGIAGTIIPAQAQASADGILWYNESEIIIGSNGTALGTFYCSKTGAVELGVGELKAIVGSSTLGISGWETITNTAAATLGADMESDAAYKKRIINSIFSGTALFGNYASAVYKVDNVTDVFAQDNPQDTQRVIDNITLSPHSVLVVVEGGNVEDVAYALYEVKSAGCGWNGNTIVTVIDKNFNTTNPVSFYVPEVVDVKVNIALTADGASSADLESEIQNVIVNYFNGEYAENNYKALKIRALISPTLISAVVISQVSGITITSCEVGLKTPADHAVASMIKASVTSGITWVSVVSTTFGAQVSKKNGTYNFTYNNGWKFGESAITLSDYGITVEGSPIEGDIISIIYASGEMNQMPIRLFCTETASITAENIKVDING
jgi:hypothetical protein